MAFWARSTRMFRISFFTIVRKGTTKLERIQDEPSQKLQMPSMHGERFVRSEQPFQIQSLASVSWVWFWFLEAFRPSGEILQILPKSSWPCSVCVEWVTAARSRQNLRTCGWRFFSVHAKTSFNLAASRRSLRREFLFYIIVFAQARGQKCCSVVSVKQSVQFGWSFFVVNFVWINHLQGEISVLQKVGKIQKIRTKQNLRQVKGKVSWLSKASAAVLDWKYCALLLEILFVCSAKEEKNLRCSAKRQVATG